MKTPRRFLLVLGLAMSWAAVAQAQQADGYRGLQAKQSGFRVACASVAFPCDGAAPLRLYSGTDFRVVGRLGTTGNSYGVGLSWDFAPQASAVLGWETYDLRFGNGERDSVRSTSLGIQWRY